MTEKNDSNRRRKWAPKARTGCRTCKTRHVKCDEARPICRRCVLSGFRCDGYPSKKGDQDDSPPGEDQPSGDDTTPTSEQSSLAVISTKTELEQPDINLNITAIRPPAFLHTPSEPYFDSERHSLQFFVDVTAAMVARSPNAPRFWQKLVPQAAWTHPSVRHAMLAAATSCESLLKRESLDGSRAKSEMKVLSHASKAVHSLLTDKAPLDVVLLTSATLGILDLFEGHWGTACTHVTAGAKLAQEAQHDSTGDPFISFYCQAFASALPSILKKADGPSDICPPEKGSVVRLDEAVRSLRLALDSFDRAIPKAQLMPDIDKDRVLGVLYNAKAETEWILQRWEELLRNELERISPPDDALEINIHRIESPWSNLMSDLESHLTDGTPFDVARFEVAMERTLPFYTLAKAGPNVRMREVAAELMYLGSQMRGRISPTIPPNQPVPGHIVKEEDDGG